MRKRTLAGPVTEEICLIHDSTFQLNRELDKERKKRNLPIKWPVDDQTKEERTKPPYTERDFVKDFNRILGQKKTKEQSHVNYPDKPTIEEVKEQHKQIKILDKLEAEQEAENFNKVS